MTALVIGGSGSGKSAYAEELACRLAGDKRKYYLATMKIFDAEGEKKVQRHRLLRRGKGFVTIEKAVSVKEAVEKMEKSGTVLLECVSNLTANEMFEGEKAKSCYDVVEKIINDIALISSYAENLVIVSNNVFEDGISYDEDTENYIEAMGSINVKLAALADRVIEVVAGIPAEIKKEW